MWEQPRDVEEFYRYSMALHVPPQSPWGGDYEIVRPDPGGRRGVYAMPSRLFFQPDWHRWRGLRVNATTTAQDARARAWLKTVAIRRTVPSASVALIAEDIPLRAHGTPSHTAGVPVSGAWRLNF
jgi:hypothetical protein